MSDVPLPRHLTDRAILRLTGGDCRSFLQGLISQDMDALPQGGAIFTALLTPQGKILFDFFVVDHGEEFLIDVHADAREALAKRLKLYKLRAKVSIEMVDELCVLSACSNPDIDGAMAFEDPRLPALGWRSIAPIGDYVADTDYNTQRIALGVPEFGKDFDGDEMFLLDVNYDALNGVSYKKGCFVGQEVTSRMKRKGGVRKRSLAIAFDGAALERGATVTAGDSTIGEVLSTTQAHAITLIRLDRWEKAKTANNRAKAGEHPLQVSFPAYLEPV